MVSIHYHRLCSSQPINVNKRDVIRTAGAASLGLLLGDKGLGPVRHQPAERLAENEGFWAAIRGRYRLKPDYINLENGYYFMQAMPVLDAFIERVREQNYQSS